MNVLVVDIGGTHVKLLATGRDTHRQFDSGPTLTPEMMVSQVRKLVSDWSTTWSPSAIRDRSSMAGSFRNLITWGRVGSASILRLRSDGPSRL